MKKLKLIAGYSIAMVVFSIFLSFFSSDRRQKEVLPTVEFSAIPKDAFGEEVRYGRELLLNTAMYIGPEGIHGKYLGNKMNCTNCHQNAGTKAYSFNLMLSHGRYPQYRAREGRVLTLADRVNNCIERPHNGKPLPLDSREMVAILSYLKWIYGFVPRTGPVAGTESLEIAFPPRAANPERGQTLYMQHCRTCHGPNGEGQLRADQRAYAYPPLWGDKAYQQGSSMSRVIKLAGWLKANMPYGKASWEKPFLTDEEALDIAAFINDDRIHYRPGGAVSDYPHAHKKPIDYAVGPFVDTFSAAQHKFGPFEPIVAYWRDKGLKPVY